jgi:UDP-N-acetylglucosamine:LPS N-acetylglucosamine transferase
MASKRPSVLIPIPWSAFDEQTKNAQFAVDFGIAEIVEQNTFKVGKLTASVTHIIKNYSEIIRKTKNKVSPDKGACEKVVDVVEECLK